MIKEALKNALLAKGVDTAYYDELIQDYVDLYELSRKYKADLKERGITYLDKSSTGTEMQKNNPSTKELLNISRQMLAILKELGVSAESALNTYEPEEDERL